MYYCETTLFFTCKHISFQAKFCILIVISLKTLKKIFFVTKCSYVDFKIGSKVIKCNNRSILQTVFLFCSGPTTKTLKRIEVFQKA